MKIPVGKCSIKSRKIEGDSAIEDFLKVLSREKTGYMTITLKGRTGMEEGIFIIENGKVIGAHYDYLNYESDYVAEKALKRCLNALNADQGIYEVYTVSGEQCELMKVFNEDFLLLESRDKDRIDASIPMSFSYEYEENEVEEAEETRKEILKEYNIPDFEARTEEEKARELEKRLRSGESSAEEVEEKMNEYLEEK